MQLVLLGGVVVGGGAFERRVASAMAAWFHWARSWSGSSLSDGMR
ncbi:hypothetical protein [Actinomadura sp. 6N118]